MIDEYQGGYPLQWFADVFAEREEPLTVPEVAEEIACSEPTARRKLKALEDHGVLRSKRAGARVRVWWAADS